MTRASLAGPVLTKRSAGRLAFEIVMAGLANPPVSRFPVGADDFDRVAHCELADVVQGTLALTPPS